MTAEVTTLGLAVDSRQVRSASSDLDRFTKSGERSESASLALTQATRGLGAALGGLSAGVALKRFFELADTYSQIEAKLRLVSTASMEARTAQAALFEIAQRSRTDLGETVNLYSALARSAKSLGASQQTVLGVTETINQAIQLSGASAASSQAALVQLGQGLASGTLRGEELNSVMEQTPRLALALADGLGVSIGQLRKLGTEGKLTSDVVLGALQKSSESVKRDFGELPLTVGQASTQSANSMLELVGAIDKVSGASRALADYISGSAARMKELADEIRRGAEGANDIGLLAQAFLVVKETVQVLWANVKFVFEAMGREIGAILAQLKALSTLDLDAFNAISEAVKADAQRARAELDAYEREVLSRKPKPLRAEDFFAPIPAVPQKPPGDAKESPFDKEIKKLREQIALVGQLTELEKINARITIGDFGKINAAQQERLRGLASALDLVQELQARTDAAPQIDVAAVKRQLDSLTQAYSAADAILEASRAAALVDERAYFDAKRGLLNLNTDAEVRKLEAENEALQRTRANAAERIKLDQQIADNTAKIVGLRTQQAGALKVIEIQEKSAAAQLVIRFEEAEAAAKSYLDTLRRAQQMELATFGRGDRARQQAQGRSQIEQRYEEQRQRLESEKRQGRISQSTYDDELARIQRFQEAALRIYQEGADQRIALEQQGALGASEALANYLDNARNVASQYESLFTTALGGIEDAFTQMVVKGKADWNSLANEILAGLTRIVVKQLLIKPVEQLLGNFNYFSILSAIGGGTVGGLGSGSLGSGVGAAAASTVGMNQKGGGRESTVMQTINVASGVSKSEMQDAIAKGTRESNRQLIDAIERGLIRLPTN